MVEEEDRDMGVSLRDRAVAAAPSSQQVVSPVPASIPSAKCIVMQALELSLRLNAPHYWMSGSSEGHEGENDAPYEAGELLAGMAAYIDMMIENLAERLYNQWEDIPGFVPWVPRGNSLKQDEARADARKILERPPT